ncbi:MAG: hypothetical protein IH944_10245 [Armatimonadetes bacterium]|nr:hypothetical protein [Armatimonadota bacterium]
MDRVLGMLGGRDVTDQRLRDWCASADVIYAADCGADRVIGFGFKPIVVGDFDSFTSLDSSHGLRLEKSTDQSTTDCDKLLDLVENDGHQAVTLAGSEGDLPDHVLATYSSAQKSHLQVRIAYRRGIGWLVRPGVKLDVSCRRGQRVSLIPLDVCIGVQLSGVEWPLTGVTLAPSGALSVSNCSVETVITASLDSGCALLFLETPEVRW